MDLIYTDPSRVDQGVLSAYGFDLSYGAEENDFEVTLGANEPMIEPGSFVYIEGTEYGGQVDGMKVKTDGETVTYKGRTWHGILNSKVIEPLKADENTTGKNLINLDIDLLNSTAFWPKTDVFDAAEGAIQYKDNTQYTVSFDATLAEGSGAVVYLRFAYSDGSVDAYGGHEMVDGRSGTEGTRSITSVAGKTVANLRWDGGVGGDFTLNWFQVEEGAIATPYNPYGSVGGVTIKTAADPVYPNLFNPNEPADPYSHDTYTVASDGTIVITTQMAGSYRFVRIPIDIPPGTVVSCRAKWSVSGNNNGRIAIAWTSTSGEVRSIPVETTTSGSVVTATITSPTESTDTLCVFLYANSGGVSAVGDTATYEEVQIVEGAFTSTTMPKFVEYVDGASYVEGYPYADKYLIISGDANDCVRYIVNRQGLSELFAVPEEKTGINISEYKFHRYCKGYDGLRAMLEDANAKLKIAWKDRSVLLYAEPIADYTESPIDGDIASLTVEQHKNKVNHLICLGKGELEAREIIHLYVDQNGKIGDAQFYTGMDEYTDTYENTNAESSENLRSGGVSRLKELRNNDKAEIALPETEGLSYDIGDIVGASEIRSGVKVAAAVTQKIVKINNGVVSADYKTGG